MTHSTHEKVGSDRWTARFSGYSEGWNVYGHDEHGEYLVAENIGPYADDAEAEAEAEREARLIAAAPELLEHGDRLVDLIGCVSDEVVAGAFGDNVFKAFYELRAAIAKAKGQDQ